MPGISCVSHEIYENISVICGLCHEYDFSSLWEVACITIWNTVTHIK